MKAYLSNPGKRRQALSLASGSLILIALVAGKLLGAPSARDVLMVLAALVAGSDIALRAFASLRNRHVSIELLVTIAAAGALWIGEYWEAAAVTFLFIFGAYLEARTLSHTRRVLGELLDLAPVTALVLRDGQQVEVMPNEVEPGESVLVKPGAKLPVDGEVIEGRSAVDESMITGEPMHEEKIPGSKVFAGTVNQTGFLRVRAVSVGADTTLARIVRRVEEAQEEKAPTQRFIERFARWYTPFIIGLSVVVYLISRNIELALTLLVIGCPGALVISTPVSVIAGIGRAARQGILIKGGEYLENAGKISALALDKTGTLTEGKPSLTDIIAFQPERQAAPMLAYAGEDRVSIALASSSRWGETQSEALFLAAVAESRSEHPLARAILAGASHLGEIPEPEEFEYFPGKGVRALYRDDAIIAGTGDFLKDQAVNIPAEAGPSLDALKSSGKTAVMVARNGALIAILGVADAIRPTSAEMVRRLRSTGIKHIVMLTGDDRLTAQTIAGEAGIEEVRSELLPEDKLQVIRGLQANGHVVAMVGDGVNDAPALAAADIGLAMGAAGTDVAIETADIALMSDDLMKIPEAIRVSKATLRNIRQNVAIALATVTILLAGVLLGKVHMAGGMLIHEASVLIVIVNGMRLLRL